MTLARRWALYLYSSFRQVNPGSQLGTDMDVRVMGEMEEPLQLLQLLCGEGSANSPLVLFFFCRRKHASWVSDLDASPLGRCSYCFVLSSPNLWPLLNLGPWILGIGA